ncbi:MAG: NAD-dependent epimerase/dehydratase family protein [bacterium]
MSGTAAEFVVTGGAGFIGSHLVDVLASRGRVLVLDDLSTGCADNLRRALASGNVRLAVGDVCDARWVAGELARVPADATLFHLATRNLRRSLSDPHEAARVNVVGTRTVAAAWAGRRGRFVHVSTSEVYGSSEVALCETSPTEPLTAYGSTKLEGERHVAALRDAGALDAVILRPFNAYGPRAHVEGDAGELIPRWLVRAARGERLPIFGDGQQTRTFTFVTDTVDAIARAAEHPAANRGIGLIASAEEVSVLAVARAIAGIVGRELRVQHLPARPGDLRRQRADASATRRLLGWHPSVAFADGLARTWAALEPLAHALVVSDRNWHT